MSACSGGGGSAPPATDPGDPNDPFPTVSQVYAVPTGLQGSLTVQLEGRAAVTLTDNQRKLLWNGTRNASYSVAVVAQPPAQYCTVLPNSGTLSSAVVDIAVTCETLTVTAQTAPGAVRLSWNSVGAGATYNVYAALESDLALNDPEVLMHTAVASPYVVQALPIAPIYLRVEAVHGDGVKTLAAQVSATPLPALNDTGMTQCTDGSALGPCPADSLVGQDAERGRDARAAQASLLKLGAGVSGFDYTRLDAQGDALPDDSVPWSCVRDNVTGLVWEVKTGGAGLQQGSSTFSWHSTAMNTNGGEVGTSDGGDCNGIDCDTQSYVNAVNGMSLCNFNDWRLPNIEDLRSLADYSRTGSVLDADYFPDTGTQFWSATTYAYSPTFAFQLATATGTTPQADKSTALSVRLVRGEGGQP